jgi:hypothetical protein
MCDQAEQMQRIDVAWLGLKDLPVDPLRFDQSARLMVVKGGL